MLRQALGVSLLALVVLTACGGGTGGVADDPSTGGATAGPQLLGLHSGTAAGGTHLGPTAIDVTTDEGRRRVVGDLRAPFAGEVADALAAVVVPPGQRLYAGVVDIGCGTPVDATMTWSNGRLSFEPVYDRKPPMECFAAVTTLALALVPEGWSGAAPAP